MSLSQVYVSNDVWLVCVTHALTTEKEEVMGLLLGDIEKGMSGQKAHITGLSVLRRSDKKKDRVEISPEQLADASSEAEKLSEKLGKRTRVIGWYHSHPHITVLPSHVGKTNCDTSLGDIQTQASYQMLDPGFVGLIFSCFNKDPATTSGRIRVTAFQSVDVSNRMVSEDLIDLSDDPPTRQLDSHVRWDRLEVPLFVVPAPTGGPNTLTTLSQLQQILFDEEQSAYRLSLEPHPGQTKTHPLVELHSSAVYQKSLYRLLELEALPALALLRDRQKQNLQRIEALQLQLRTGNSNTVK